MNIWAKMVTALRGGAEELGEAMIDGQALRILDQEVRDASEELNQSREALAHILARQKLGQERSRALQQKIAENESYALQALAKKEEALALEVAEKIAELEAEYRQELSQVEIFGNNIDNLRAAVKMAEQNIKRLKQQVDTIKATENVQRAQAAMAERYLDRGSKLRTAMDSLEQIKAKQRFQAAHLQAAAEIAQEAKQDPLFEKLAKAGIVSADRDAQTILERLRKKQS